MQLKFYAREDALVREAGVHPRVGEATRYYGRAFDSESRSYPATREGIAVESGTEDAEKCAKQLRKGMLFADRQTCDALGVAFVDFEFKGGAHVVKAASKKPEQSAHSGKVDS